MPAPVRVPLLTSVVLLLLGACTNSTTLTSTWRAPDATTVSPVGKTIVAVFLSSNESQRRPAEDRMAGVLTAHGARGIAGYALLPTPPDAQHLDSDAVRRRLDEAGANAIVMMRVVGKDQRITYTPGTVWPASYRGVGPYWGTGWGTVYSPGSLQTDTDVSVETLVYSLKPGQPDKLIWASTSRTTNPNDLRSLISEVADATGREMQRQGFLSPSP